MASIVSRIVKTGKTIRTHWKKSIVGCIAVGYGAQYATELYKIETLRREYCQEALKYGLKSIQLTQRPRKVIVFLNPAVSRGKGVKLFEKNAAPILNLAGIQVDVVKLEYEGQAKQCLTVLENGETDAIVVAGGDGTLLETVTGMMRKKDKAFCRNVTLGVLPLGRTNRFATRLFGEDPNQVRFIMDAAMAIVEATIKPIDILEIKTEDGKDTYALSGLQLGAYNDAEERKSKYWYFGPLKSRWTYVRASMGQWPPNVKLDMEYIPATAPIKVKRVLTEEKAKQLEKGNKWSLFGLFFKSRMVPKDEDYEEIYQITEEDWVKRELSTVELTVMSSNYDESTEKSLNIGIGPTSPNKTEFIGEGWRRIKSKSLLFGTEQNERLKAHKIRLKPEKKEDEQIWFNVDGEAFESCPVEMTLLRNKLNIFWRQNPSYMMPLAVGTNAS